ncbi:MAG: MATE family efflux transporter [Bacteroidales bacterium]|nr:MATE family efflux transporter [Bacteroidales bacterium]
MNGYFERIVLFLNKGHERSIKAKKNILASFVLKGGGIIVSLILVPLTINFANPVHYGIWITLNSIFEWFTFLDIGIGNGLRNKLAEAESRGEYKLARMYNSSAYFFLGLIMLLVFVVFQIVNLFFLDWNKLLKIESHDFLNFNLFVSIVFFLFCFQFVLSLINKIFQAVEKPAFTSLINFLSNVLLLLIILVLFHFQDGSLISLGIASSIAPVVILLFFNLYFFHKKLKIFAPAIRYVRIKYARDILKIGVKFFLMQFSAIIIFSSNNYLINYFIGATEVTNYNVVFKYFSVVSNLFIIVITPFWSSFTHAFVKNEIPWLKTTIRNLLLIYLLFTMAIVALVIVSKFALKLWIGDDFAVPTSLIISVAGFFTINMLMNLYNYLINGIGKIQLQYYLSIIVILIEIPLAVVFCVKLKMGTNGIILANIIAIIPFVILMPIQLKKLLEGRAKGIWNK